MITDLISLSDYFEQLVGQLPDVYFLPISNGEKGIDEIEAYYTNDYRGTTAFFQVAEVPRATNGAGLDTLKFMCSLSIAAKPADASARAGLEVRDYTLKLMLRLLGLLELAAETSQQEVEEQGLGYEMKIEPVERIFPIGLLANVDLDGHYMDVDVTIPANHLLFPD
ncbi:hypothetical protein [Rudanella lutea]|uniref:hypothetical protein n=1 Tax=Rudanella lutea TaxID=451374 RepID=UPI00036E4A21|nr:hypothetical protein [Rudanella lutea]